jgi:hypothetical protein
VVKAPAPCSGRLLPAMNAHYPTQFRPTVVRGQMLEDDGAFDVGCAESDATSAETHQRSVPPPDSLSNEASAGIDDAVGLARSQEDLIVHGLVSGDARPDRRADHRHVVVRGLAPDHRGVGDQQPERN